MNNLDLRRRIVMLGPISIAVIVILCVTLAALASLVQTITQPGLGAGGPALFPDLSGGANLMNILIVAVLVMLVLGFLILLPLVAFVILLFLIRSMATAPFQLPALPGLPFPLNFPFMPNMPAFDLAKFIECLQSSQKNPCGPDAGGKIPGPGEVWGDTLGALERARAILEAEKQAAEAKLKALGAYIEQQGGNVPKEVQDAYQAGQDHAKNLEDASNQMVATTGQMLKNLAASGKSLFG